MGDASGDGVHRAQCRGRLSQVGSCWHRGAPNDYLRLCLKGWGLGGYRSCGTGLGTVAWVCLCFLRGHPDVELPCHCFDVCLTCCSLICALPPITEREGTQLPALVYLVSAWRRATRPSAISTTTNNRHEHATLGERLESVASSQLREPKHTSSGCVSKANVRRNPGPPLWCVSACAAQSPKALCCNTCKLAYFATKWI